MRLTTKALGEFVRLRRLMAGLTQHELARRATMSIRSLREIENGRAGPRALTAQRLAAALGLSLADQHILASHRSSEPISSRVQVAVLGALSVKLGDLDVYDLSPTQRDLLGLLALHAPQAVTVAEIVDTLWGTKPPKTCLNLVHFHVRRLRLALEPERRTGEGGRTVVRSSRGYLLALDRDQLDLAKFDDVVAKAEAARARHAPQVALELLKQAVGFWRGAALADAGLRILQHPAVLVTNTRRLMATLSLADTAIELRHREQPLVFLRGIIRDEPLHEGLHARLMLALAITGDRATALQVFVDVRRRLADDLGIEPGLELRAAYLTVLRGEHPNRR